MEFRVWKALSQGLQPTCNSKSRAGCHVSPEEANYRQPGVFQKYLCEVTLPLFHNRETQVHAGDGKEKRDLSQVSQENC